MDPTDAPRKGQPAREGQDEPARLLTLREAAELCGPPVTHTGLRKRADRGTLQTVLRDGVRCVPLSELERAGLLPDAELRQLRDRVGALERELAEHRLLAERAESNLARERDAEVRAREQAELAAATERAAALEAAGVAAKAEQDRLELERRIAGAGPLKAWRLARELRKD